MGLELWHTVVAVCIAVGAAALTGRYALYVWDRDQLRRLNRETAGLSDCWGIIEDLPVEALSAPIRQVLGAIMSRCLARARRIRPKHPYLMDQQARIDAFVATEPQPRNGRPGVATRGRAMEALDRLENLVAETRPDGDLSRDQIRSCRAALARRLTELEFLSDQHEVMQADYLRRVTRALDVGGGLWDRQFSGSRSALPTQ